MPNTKEAATGDRRTRTFHGVCTSNAVNRYSQYPGSTRTRTFHGVCTSNAVNRYSQYPGSTRARTFHGVCTSSAVNRYSQYPGSKFAMQSAGRVKTRCLFLNFSFLPIKERYFEMVNSFENDNSI